MPDSSALIVIDVQRIFTDATSPWGSPMAEEVVPRIVQRITAYDGTIVATRYVAPLHPEGAWQAYFERWPFALQPPDSPSYAFDPRVAPALRGVPVVDATTFGKWGPALREAIGPAQSVDLVGVATDCCVLSTALAIADSGIATRVWAPGCAGSTPDEHRKALSIMELYAPLIEVLGD
ncbi:isochorismatase family protein [Flexivirga sp. ID2601S]|uniref:Isochorismatase family protein n=1 Tax=Flexivirga aerilata TaxID=1656889 RepID=A0A849AKG0_9MICO|nr:isochorismatase family protein [Flexivirga aerilata]NNG40895.1 isochorismatase family protein [Flexivirga aerilata]